MGCLIGLLVILVIFIWFSGHYFIITMCLGLDGYTGDFASDFFATVVMVIAVIIDIVIIYEIVFEISYQIHKYWEKRIAKIKEEYGFNKVVLINDGEKYDIDESFINTYVVNAFKILKNNLKEPISKCSDLESQFEDIFSHDRYKNDHERYKNIISKDNIERLEKIKEKRDAYNNKLSTIHIQLLHQNSRKIKDLIKLFEMAKGNYAVVPHLMDNIIPNEIPLELNCFEYDCPPLILKFDNFYFCFFSNVILIFDSNGRFSTAVDPSALNYKTVVDFEYKEDDQCYYYISGILTIGMRVFEFDIDSKRKEDTRLYRGISEYRKKDYSEHDISEYDVVPDLLNLLSSVSEDSKLKSIEDIYQEKKWEKNYFCMIKKM